MASQGRRRKPANPLCQHATGLAPGALKMSNADSVAHLPRRALERRLRAGAPEEAIAKIVGPQTWVRMSAPATRIT